MRGYGPIMIDLKQDFLTFCNKLNICALEELYGLNVDLLYCRP